MFKYNKKSSVFSKGGFREGGGYSNIWKVFICLNLDALLRSKQLFSPFIIFSHVVKLEKGKNMGENEVLVHQYLFYYTYGVLNHVVQKLLTFESAIVVLDDRAQTMYKVASFVHMSRGKLLILPQFSSPITWRHLWCHRNAWNV